MSTIEHIFVSPLKAQPLTAVAAATAVVGRGLEGDRYVNNAGSFSKPNEAADAGRNVTLIEGEAIDAALAEHGVDLRDGLSRRNLVTRGIAFAGLDRAFFVVGNPKDGVVLRVERTCPPCRHLLKFVPRSMTALKGRGGLRTTVLRGGAIRVGDPIVCLSRADARELVGDV